MGQKLCLNTNTNTEFNGLPDIAHCEWWILQTLYWPLRHPDGTKG